MQGEVVEGSGREERARGVYIQGEFVVSFLPMLIGGNIAMGSASI